ncbi:MAG TPA: lysophospholipid acyltransferase family protein [Anaerolineaceae bacterium]|nr:lysophospholipid acyltransferase family protein [Anaerolineaceae bacterium]
MTINRADLLNLIRKLIAKFCDQKIYNPEIPESLNGAILVTNHISRLDVVFLMLSTKREDVIALTASNYRRAPFFGTILKKIGVIWLDRGESDFKAMRETADYIKKGWIVGLAPEGRRSRSGKLIEAKPGAVLIAMKTGAPIIPVGLVGTADMGKAIKEWRKMDVTINFGEAFYLPEREENEHNRDYVQRALEEVMCRIAVLIPEEQRGFYAAHPRVKSLLAEIEEKKNNPEA